MSSSLKTVCLYFALFSSVYAKISLSSKTGDKVLVRYFDPRDLESEVQAKTFEELRKSLITNPKLKFKEIDCSLNESDCSTLSSETSSTYLLYDGTQLTDIYYGPPNLESLRNYCLAQMGFKLPRSLPVPTVGETPDDEFTAPLLTSANFDDSVKNNITFVIFFAPWCGHCKKFKPVWNLLTKKYKNHSNINIARVDCVAEQQSGLCLKQNVSGFPTINLYKQGVLYKEYEGGRKLGEITDFVESHQRKETEEGWAERDKQRTILHFVNKAKRAAKRALEAENGNTTGTADTTKSSCYVPVEDKNGMCLATYSKL